MVKGSQFLFIVAMILGMLVSSTTMAADSNNDVMCVQEALADFGYNPGPADGLYGKGTGKAAAEFASKATSLDLPMLSVETAPQWCEALKGYVYVPPRAQTVAACTFPAQMDIDALAADTSSPFIGVWNGSWGVNGELVHTLIITEVGQAGVKGYYVNDAFANWKVRAFCAPFPRGQQQQSGSIDGTVLRLSLQTFASVEYTLSDDGKSLRGVYRTGGNETPGTFYREQ
jgi:hypothetical protein